MSERDMDIAYVQLLRAWAKLELDRLTPDARAAFLKGSLTYGHPEVDEAVRQHIDLPIGTCDRCGERAPLKNSGKPLPHPNGGTWEQQICAWGCL